MKNRKVIKELEKILKYRSPENLKETENKMDIAIKIYEAIKANNFTLKEFANKMQKNVIDIEHWVDGTYDFSIKELSKIEIVLNIKLLNTDL